MRQLFYFYLFLSPFCLCCQSALSESIIIELEHLHTSSFENSNTPNIQKKSPDINRLFAQQVKNHQKFSGDKDSFLLKDKQGFQETIPRVETHRKEQQINTLAKENPTQQQKRRYFYITLELLAILLLIALTSIFLWYRAFKRIKKQKEITARLLKEKEDLLNKLTKTQNQLIQSEKMASLGQLTAGIAHEINNPINFITTSVQGLKLDFKDLQKLLQKVYLLKKKYTNEHSIEEIIDLKKEIDAEFLENEMISLIDHIEQGANRTHEIVKHLQAFSRNTSSIFLESDIHEGLDSTLVILNNKLKDRIKIHRNYAKLPKIKCQITHLNQVFLNILDNAIYAIQDKGDIYITTRQFENSIFVSIRDTGIGIDAATKNRIFEPFFTTKEVGEGMGLGLSTSFGIIDQHGGNIRVESEVGMGTEFIIELPVVQ